MRCTMSNLTVAEARDQFAEILNRAAYGKERIIVMRRNKKMAALVSIEDLEALEALEDQLDTREAEKVLAKPMAPVAWDKVKAELKARRAKQPKKKAWTDVYKVFIDPRARKQLLAVSSVDQRRIEKKIDSLAATPRPADCKKLQGGGGLYRVRVGDYRVVYQVKDRELIVLLVRFGHRREVYR